MKGRIGSTSGDTATILGGIFDFVMILIMRLSADHFFPPCKHQKILDKEVQCDLLDPWRCERKICT